MFDPKKPVQTRDGRKARIVCTDRKTNTQYTVLALIQNVGTDNESAYGYTADGSAGAGLEQGRDLVNIPNKRYVNLYRTPKGFVEAGIEHLKLEYATEARFGYRGIYIKTVEIEV